MNKIKWSDLIGTTAFFILGSMEMLRIMSIEQSSFFEAKIIFLLYLVVGVLFDILFKIISK